MLLVVSVAVAVAVVVVAAVVVVVVSVTAADASVGAGVVSGGVRPGELVDKILSWLKTRQKPLLRLFTFIYFHPSKSR